MAGGLALLLSKAGASSKKDDAPDSEAGEDEEKDDDKEMGLEDEYLEDAFSAVKSGDKMAFVEAMKSFKGC